MGELSGVLQGFALGAAIAVEIAMTIAKLRAVPRRRAAAHALITRAQLGGVATARATRAEASPVPVVVLVPVHTLIRCA
jgi:hypothetical protein